MATLITLLVRLTCIVMLAVVFSCGGGGGSVSITPTGGSLAVSITGLPAGVNAAVTVIGPNNFSQSVTGAQTLSGLSAGTYTVTAASVMSAGTTYSPLLATQSVAVSAGATANVTVSYNAGAPITLALQQVTGATGFTNPLYLTTRPGDSALFIVEQPGRIRIVRNGVPVTTPFLDISSGNIAFTSGGEQGLLSMVFDPNYTSNRFFYIYYTDSGGNIAVDRYTVSASNVDQADTTTRLRIIGIPHPGQTNHNGGLLKFGPDGFLYIGTGDGGGGGDPSGNGQNLNVLLGKLLRIDVSAASLAQPYVSPPSNPFSGQAGRRAEIWAYGLRNPWRYAFDLTTNQLYIADVGQDVEEEVDVQPSTSGGLNYGWNIMEGSLCFSPSSNCNKSGLTLPVFTYDHATTGGCSITGGYVYRGSAIPEITGRYFYSDFCGGWLKSFLLSGNTATEQTDWNITNVGNILSFGEDSQGELYMLSQNGSVYRIVKQ